MWKGTVARFCENGAELIQRMTDELHAGTYEHSRPSRFCVTYPKRREIVAQQFRGGGHARAAGCTLDGPMESAKAQIVPALIEAVKQWKASLPS